MEKYEVELLSPLFYNSSLDSGAAGANVTFDWIGDIAIDYAINFSLSNKKIVFKYNSHKPDYNKIKDFDFISSIAYSMNNVKKTRVYDFATSFISDGYIDSKVMEKSNRSPFRNWIKRQGLEPGNKFYFYVLSKGNKKLPEVFTIRLGNMKICIGVCRRIDQNNNKNKSDTLWINLFTTNLLSNKLNIDDIGMDNITYVSDRYVIKKNVDSETWRKLFDDYV